MQSKWCIFCTGLATTNHCYSRKNERHISFVQKEPDGKAKASKQGDVSGLLHEVDQARIGLLEPWAFLPEYGLGQVGAQERTRTFTAVKPLAPEASASTNSATWARAGYYGPAARLSNWRSAPKPYVSMIRKTGAHFS